MLNSISQYLNRQYNNRGMLMIIGGAEDRTDEKYVLQNVVEYSKATTISVIPSASGYPVGLGEDYYYAFNQLGVTDVRILDMRSPEDAMKEENLKHIRESNLVFMTGGDQVRLFNVIGNTPLANLIRERHFHDGLSVAGTSAGAAIVSNPMIYDGSQLGLYKGRVHFSEGLGLMEGVTVDTHFVARGRLGRLTQFLCTGISTHGIGVGEDTGLFIKPDFTADVIGTGMVSVVNTNNAQFNNYDEIEEDMPISIQGINAGFLQDGTTFDLKTWSIVSSVPKKNEEAILRAEEY
ncbi:MAG: cyanophycinase [Marinilabiliales bacterium]|nr:MAG: cyanophycinase [Marinilabiliales bacterium]